MKMHVVHRLGLEGTSVYCTQGRRENRFITGEPIEVTADEIADRALFLYYYIRSWGRPLYLLRSLNPLHFAQEN